MIRLELNRDEPGDGGSDDRYAAAARLLKDWLREGILRKDDQPALYVYHQTFEVEGKKFTRARGFWRGFDSSRSARVRSIRTNRRSPVPRPTVWPFITQPDSISVPSSASIPTQRRKCTARSRPVCAIALRWWRPITWVSKTGSGS